MRQLGVLEHETHALRFRDHLATLQITAHVDEASQGWAVWVEDDDHLDRARQELTAFEQQPDAPLYVNAPRKAETFRQQADKHSRKQRVNYKDVRTDWQRRNTARPGPVSIIMMVLALAVGVTTGIGARYSRGLSLVLFQPPGEVEINDADASPVIDPMQHLLGGAGNWWATHDGMFDAVLNGQLWRLITPIFLHFGVLHLVFNLSWLYMFGAMIEGRRGTLIFLGLALAGAVIGNLAEAMWIQLDLFHALPDGQHWAAFGGLSGVNYAFFGYAWLLGKRRPHLGVVMKKPEVTLLFGWLLLCMTGLLGNIANAAHVAGLLVGIAAALLPQK